MNDMMDARCADEMMDELLGAAQSDAENAVFLIDRALTDYPLDPRLHFLKGSLLVGLKRFVGAHLAMSRAIAISPDYHLARFQLGFLELTSGEVDAALLTWGPLDALPSGHWLGFFTAGLRSLAEDRFDECIAALRAGIASNNENQPLNADMELIVAECEKLGGKDESPIAPDGVEISTTSFLLGTKKSDRRH